VTESTPNPDPDPAGWGAGRTADPTWDIDWDVMRRASEAGHEAVEGMRTLGEALDGELPTLLRAFVAVNDGVRTGEAAGYEALRALREVIGASVGSAWPGVTAFIDTQLMMLRLNRCRAAEAAGQLADWPAPAELDPLISALDRAEDPTTGFTPALGGLAGIHRAVLVGLLLARIQLEVKDGFRHRSPVWFDQTIARVREIQRNAELIPPALAGLITAMRELPERLVPALERHRLNAIAVHGLPPEPEFVEPEVVEPQIARPGVTQPEVAAPERGGAHSRLVVLPDSLTAPSLMSPRALATAFDLLGGRSTTGPRGVISRAGRRIQEVTMAGRWTAADDAELASLREIVESGDGAVDGDGTNSTASRVLVVLLANARLQVKIQSSVVAEWPGAAELMAQVVELEQALAVAVDAGPISKLVPLIRLSAGILLLGAVDAIRRGDPALNGQSEDDLHRRAGAHLAALPPELVAVVSPMMPVLAKRLLAAGGDQDPEIDRALRDYSGAHDADGRGIATATAAARAANLVEDLDAIIASIDTFRSVRRGLAAGHPDHAVILGWLCLLYAARARLTRSPRTMADALDAGVEGFRVAASNQVPTVLARLMGALMIAAEIGYRQSTTQVEDVLGAALAELGPTAAIGATDGSRVRAAALLSVLGAALGVRSRAGLGDESAPARVRAALDEVERLLSEPEPTSGWYITARAAFSWAALQAITGRDARAAEVATRLAELLEAAAPNDPALTETPQPPADAAEVLGTSDIRDAGELRLMREKLTLLFGDSAIGAAARRHVWPDASEPVGPAPASKPAESAFTAPEFGRDPGARAKEETVPPSDDDAGPAPTAETTDTAETAETAEAPPPPTGAPAVADLTLDVDWTAMRQATQSARQMADAMRLMAPSLPGDMRGLTDAFTSLWDSVEASGPQSDQTLTALRQLAATMRALGEPDLTVNLDALIMAMRIGHCREAERGGQPAQWPEREELDVLVAALARVDDPMVGVGAAFGQMAGMHRLYLAFLLTARVWLDVREGSVERLPAWFDRTIERVREIQRNLDQASTPMSGLARSLRANADAWLTALDQGRAVAVARHGPPPPEPDPSLAPGPADVLPASPTESEAAAPPAGPDPETPPSVDVLAEIPLADMTGALSGEGLAGMRAFFDAVPTGDPQVAAMKALVHVMDAVTSHRWGAADDAEIETLRKIVESRPGTDGPAPDGPTAAGLATAEAVLVVLRATRNLIRSDDPMVADRPGLDEMMGDLTALDQVLARAASDGSTGIGSPPANLSPLVRALAGIVLLDVLSRVSQGAEPPPGLTFDDLRKRAAGHLTALPTQLNDAMPPVWNTMMSRLLIDGEEGDPEVDRQLRAYSGQHDAEGGGFAAAEAAGRAALAGQDPEQLATAIETFRAFRRGLGAGHPGHADALSWLARLYGARAQRSKSPTSMTDALDASVEGFRVAGSASQRDRALAQIVGALLIATRAGYGPLAIEAEEVLGAALAELGPTEAGTDDRLTAVVLTVGLGAAAGLRCPADAGAGNESGQSGRAEPLARLVEAEAMLPEPTATDQWYRTARLVFTWAAVETVAGRQAAAAEVGARLGERMEALLVAEPELAERASRENTGTGAADLLGTGEPDEVQGIRLARETLTMLFTDSAVGAAMRRSLWPDGQPAAPAPATPIRSEEPPRPAEPTRPDGPPRSGGPTPPDEPSRSDEPASAKTPATERPSAAGLTLDVDLTAMGEAMQGARQLVEAMRLMAPTMPSDSRGMTEPVIAAWDAVEGSGPHADQTLVAFRQLAATMRPFAPPEQIVCLDATVLVLRVGQCQRAERGGQPAQWPDREELDLVIAGLVREDDAIARVGAAFGAAAGMPRVYAAALLTVRVWLDIRDGYEHQPPAWYDVTIARMRDVLLHLDRAPTPLSPLAGSLRANADSWLTGLLWSRAAAVGRLASPPPTASSARRAPSLGGEPGGPGPAVADPATARPVDPVAEPTLAELMAPLSREALAGVRAFFDTAPADDPGLAGLKAVLGLVDAIAASRWGAAEDAEIAAFRKTMEVDAAAAGGPGAANRAAAEIGLVMLRAVQHITRSDGPVVAEHPSMDELSGDLAALEDVLARLAGEAAAGRDSWATHMVSTVRGVAGVVLLQMFSLVQQGAEPPPGLTVHDLRKRTGIYLAGLPAQVRETFHPGIDLAIERLLVEGRDDDPEVDRLLRAFTGQHDAEGGGFRAAEAEGQAAIEADDPDQLTAAIASFRAVRLGLGPGHPNHADALSWLARLSAARAQLTGSWRSMDEALDAGVEAFRSAGSASQRELALTQILGALLIATRVGYVGPTTEVEHLLRAAWADPGRMEMISDEPTLKLALTVGLGAAAGLRSRAEAAGGGTPDPRARTELLARLAEAEELASVRTETDLGYQAAGLVFTWAAAEAIGGHEATAAEVAVRLSRRMEGVLAAAPELAKRVAQENEALGFADPMGTGEPDEAQRLRLSRETLMLLFTDSEAGAAARRSYWPDGDNELTAAYAGDPDEAGDAEDLSRSGELHAALAGGALAGSGPRAAANAALGQHLAERYWRGEADASAQWERCFADDGQAGPAPDEDPALATLRDAIEHLNRALATSAHVEPTVERAELMDLLARCYRELARRWDRPEAAAEAERAVEAALRELTRRVLVTDATEDALDVAGRANAMVTRAVGWCLDDGRHEAAVKIAETGRSLVLGSVTLAGRVEEVLRGSEQDAAADAWRRGDASGRLTGLTALWTTRQAGSLLATPTVNEIAVGLLRSNVDAVVYLVPAPPASSAEPAVPAGMAGLAGEQASPAEERPGHAIIVRPAGRDLVVIPLPGARPDPDTPLVAYLAAFDAALRPAAPSPAGPGPTSPAPSPASPAPVGGFRSRPAGPAWAAALDALGAWTHERLVGPLVREIDGWSLGRPARLAVVPLGELAAIPLAAAWRPDPTVRGGRRYAVHDVTLTQAVSARLLLDVLRRRHRDLTERVVFAVDPTGEFPHARDTAKGLAARQYPTAEYYGRKKAPDGPLTDDVLLAALPGRTEPGASLLHLSTHGRLLPTPALRTIEGWLPLTRILDRSRGRPPESAGGLVITNACLTDSTRAHYDESVTLATAMLAAGVTGVVGTRWPIDDDTAAVLTSRLHLHLQMGRAPAEALREAQLDLLESRPGSRAGLNPHLAALPDDRLAHPASWAGYVHHGT